LLGGSTARRDPHCISTTASNAAKQQTPPLNERLSACMFLRSCFDGRVTGAIRNPEVNGCRRDCSTGQIGIKSAGTYHQLLLAFLGRKCPCFVLGEKRLALPRRPPCRWSQFQLRQFKRYIPGFSRFKWHRQKPLRSHSAGINEFSAQHAVEGVRGRALHSGQPIPQRRPVAKRSFFQSRRPAR
jgi:hypothetical protein